VVFLLELGEFQRPAVLALDLLVVLPLAVDVVLELVPLLTRVVEGGLFGLVVEIGEQSVEVLVDFLLLVLDLLILGLALPPRKLRPFLVL
jgi:hypothetical protein